VDRDPGAVLYKRVGGLAENSRLPANRVHLKDDAMRHPTRLDHGGGTNAVECERHRDDRLQGIARAPRVGETYASRLETLVV
jgi:hypothetical protein